MQSWGKAFSFVSNNLFFNYCFCCFKLVVSLKFLFLSVPSCLIGCWNVCFSQESNKTMLPTSSPGRWGNEHGTERRWDRQTKPTRWHWKQTKDCDHLNASPHVSTDLPARARWSTDIPLCLLLSHLLLDYWRTIQFFLLLPLRNVAAGNKSTPPSPTGRFRSRLVACLSHGHYLNPLTG